MLPPLPRCSGWAYSSLTPSRVSLPRKGHRVALHIVLFEACSAFTRVAACTLARSPYFVTRYPKASDISSPPCLLRLLPAGAVAGWDSHPLESAAFSRRTPILKLRDDWEGREMAWHLQWILLKADAGVEAVTVPVLNGPPNRHRKRGTEPSNVTIKIGLNRSLLTYARYAKIQRHS